MTRIGDILTRHKTPVSVQDEVTYKQVTIRTNYKGVVLRGHKAGIEIGTKNQWAVKPDQFILSRIDARQGAFGIVPDELDGAIVTNDFLAYDLNEKKVDREFFNIFLQSPVFLNACIKASRGNTNRKRVQEDFFLDYEVNLPPLKDQKRLIRKIKVAQAKLDLADAELAYLRTLADKLKQAILQAAIRGELTAGPRKAGAFADAEPAEQLLECIATEKARLIKAKKLRKEKPLLPLTDEEIPFDLPEGWAWCRMGRAGVFERGKSRHRPRNDPNLFDDGTIPFVQTGDVARSKHNAFKIESCSGYYNQFGLSQSRIWPSGTMCITIAANIAETGFLTFPACLADSVVAFTPLVSGHTSEYLRMFIELTRTSIEEFAPATSQKNINLGIINQLALPLPPLAEQSAIVERAESLMSVCRSLEAEVAAAADHAAVLRRAVLQQAFAPPEAVVTF